MNTNLFAILTSPGFAREFDKADEGLPWLDDDGNVVAEDRAWPTEGALFDDIPGPLVVPVAQDTGD